MNSNRDVEYRLNLAKGFLGEAEQDFELRRWRSCVDNAQLSVENAGKAILMLFGIPPKTHQPAKQLAHLIDHSEIPLAIRDDIDAGEMGYKLARQGYTLRVIDLLTAQLVIEKNLFLLTLDEHFKSITKSFPLKLLPIPNTSLE